MFKNKTSNFLAFILSFTIIFQFGLINSSSVSAAKQPKVYSYSNGVKTDENGYRLIPVGKKISLGPTTGVYDNIVDVEWLSENSKIMQVLGKGDGTTVIVQAVSPGTCIVNAIVDSEYRFGYTYDRQTVINPHKFRVVKPVQSLKFSKTSETLIVGNKKQLKYTASPDNIYSKALSGISFKSSNTKVATVDKSGVVTAIKSGTVVITVSTVDTGIVTAKCTVKVVAPSLKKIKNVWYCYTGGKLDKRDTLVKHTNGKWYHVKNGKVVYDTGLVKYNGNYYYVKKGVKTNTETLVKHTNSKWYHVKNGKVVYDTGLVKYNGIYYYVKNGVKTNVETLVKHTNGKWYHVKGGKVVYDTKLVKYNGIYYYVKNGVKTNSETLVKHTNGKWYHVKGGKVVYDTSLVKFGGSYCYVKNGVFTKQTLLFTYKNQTYYIKNGKTQPNFTGNVKINGKTYYISKGKLVFSNLKISRTSLNLESGDEYGLSVTGVDSSVKVRWKSDNENTAIVTVDGTVKAFLPGKATITASVVISGKTYSVSCIVNVDGYPTYSRIPQVPSYPEVANKWGLILYDGYTEYTGEATVYTFIYNEAWQSGDNPYGERYAKALKGYMFYPLYDYGDIDYSKRFSLMYSNPEGNINIQYSQSTINHSVTIKIIVYN